MKWHIDKLVESNLLTTFWRVLFALTLTEIMLRIKFTGSTSPALPSSQALTHFRDIKFCVGVVWYNQNSEAALEIPSIEVCYLHMGVAYSFHCSMILVMRTRN